MDAVLPTLLFNARVVELDRAQPGNDPNAPSPKFAPYYRSHVDAARIGPGREVYAAQPPLARRFDGVSGVPQLMTGGGASCSRASSSTRSR